MSDKKRRRPDRYENPTLPDHAASTMARASAERRQTHRAFLLWAMQTPTLRSVRSVSRAMGRPESTVRSWFKSGHWPARCEADGDNSDQVALDLYRDDYMAEFGELEIPFVAPTIVRAIGALNMTDPLAATMPLPLRRTLNSPPASIAVTLRIMVMSQSMPS